MTNHTALMNRSFARQGRTVQSVFAADDYRWQGEPIAPPVDAELFRKGQCVAAGKIRQVGPHGLLVETDAEFPENAYLQVSFAVMENGQAVHCQPFGRVVSCSSHGVGLLMDVLEPVARDALQALLVHARHGARQPEKSARNLM
jgi:hypothetical protein